MKPPMCKLCGKAHWAFEDHYTGNSAITPDYIRDMAAGALGVTETVTKPPNNVTRDETTSSTVHVTPEEMAEDIKEGRSTYTGRPRKHKDAAARQRAYRERQTS